MGIGSIQKKYWVFWELQIVFLKKAFLKYQLCIKEIAI